MVYTPLYTSETLIEGLTGETVDGTTSPTTTELLDWIEEVEADMTAKGYATVILTDEIIDVPAGRGDLSSAILDGVIFSDSGYSGGKVILLPHTPFTTVTKVERNLAGYSLAENWEEIKEGPGANTDFLILKTRYKVGMRGYALYCYRKIPAAGYQKLKLTYTWGYNLPTTVLREYATARTSLMLLYSKYLRKEPIFDFNIAGLSSKLNPFTKVHVYILERIEAIKEQWLPSEYAGVAILP